jgi:hypothetical protein
VQAALQALAALVHCPAHASTSAPLLEHFPLAQALSLKVSEASDKVRDKACKACAARQAPPAAAALPATICAAWRCP